MSTRRKIKPPADDLGRQYASMERAATKFDTSVVTLRRYAAEGKFPIYRFGSQLLRVDLAEVEAALIEVVPSAMHGGPAGTLGGKARGKAP